MSRALRLALLLIVVGCAYLFLAHPYWFPLGVSASSVSIDHQFKIAFWIFGTLFIVGHMVLIFVLSKKPPAEGKISNGSWRLEVTWTLAVTIIFFWFNISGERLWSSIMPAEKQAGQIEVEVTGAQFQWYFRYPAAVGSFGRINDQEFGSPGEANPLGSD